MEKSSSNWSAFLASQQREIEQQSLWRERKLIGSSQQPSLLVAGQQCLNFSSNDYLGLAAHPKIAQAIASGVAKWGAGSGASHLVCGHSTVHHELEERLADFVGAERALLFSTGYMANLAVNTAFTNKHDLCLHDKLNHASLIDGAQLGAAQFKRYAHTDLTHAEKIISAQPHQRLMLVSDAVFSMDGDVAPLTELVALAKKYSGLLCLDDAHGVGVLGEQGAGVLSQFGLRPSGDVLMVGTLGKAFGSFGAFVAGDALFIEHLIQTARSYIFTTALPPASVIATTEALNIIQSEHAELWHRLANLIDLFKQGCASHNIPLLDSSTPIQPVMVGDEALALELSAELQQAGFLVTAIRTPTVAKGQARLRVTLTAAHSQDQVESLIAALAAAIHMRQSEMLVG